ncbi:DUF202 domain-containing protein [Noviherbaspirillum cavernae]|uniref:DUF202 domain-containing protein n=2 Tax=Noviherbaspirillum cavernae TaxID=2320862 RepID=A0A418X5W9_9BURK|nr:DUF202 domain-containing protein [Noviherbaspirillum cavernae]
MSFQRTRMSADRTLMSVIRTSLSLISFGFTIAQFFSHLQQTNILKAGEHAPRNFGLALVILGIGILLVGIVYHVNFMRELRAERTRLMAAGLVHGESSYPLSFTLMIAMALLILGFLAFASMVWKIGPFY